MTSVGWSHKAGLAVAGIAVTLLVATGCAPNGEAAPVPTTTRSATPTPEATETTQPTEPGSGEYAELSVEDIEIEAGLSAEAYAERVVENLNTWEMHGANDPELIETYYEVANTELEAIYRDRAEQTAQYFEEGLFAPGWEQSETFTNLRNGRVNIQLKNLDFAMLTQAGNNGEKWQRGQTITAVTEETLKNTNPDVVEDGDSRLIIIETTEFNNASENIIGWKIQPDVISFNGAPARYVFETIVIDGKEYIQEVRNVS